VKREIKDLQSELKRRDRELRALADDRRRIEERAAQAEAAHRAEIGRHHGVAAKLDEREADLSRIEGRLTRLEQELAEERRRYAELAEARRHESDARYVRRLALEAFNRSEHIERVVAISRSLGEPIVHVYVDGVDLPRAVRLVVAWDISWYEYVVRLDLHEQTVTVDEVRHGDDPQELPRWRLQPNAVLRSNRIVLSMQAYGVGSASA
jgi:ribonuclease Y